MDIVYKYRKINKNFWKLLKHQQLYFANPSEFNDPFDCRLRLNWKCDPEEINKWLRKYVGNRAEELINYFKQNEYDPKVISEFQEPLLEQMGKTFILSLSEINDNILMWSHYANYHKGVCLGFKTKKLNNMVGIEF